MDDGLKIMLAEGVLEAILESLEDDMGLGWYQHSLRDGLEQQRWWQQVAQREVVKVQATLPEHLRWTDLLTLDVAAVRGSETDEDLVETLIGLATTVVAWIVDIHSRGLTLVPALPEPTPPPLKFGFALPDLIPLREIILEGATA